MLQWRSRLYGHSSSALGPAPGRIRTLASAHNTAHCSAPSIESNKLKNHLTVIYVLCYTGASNIRTPPGAQQDLQE